MRRPALRVAAALSAGLAFFLAAGAARAAGSGSWFRYPLPGAEVKSLVADPSVPGAFYLGTAQGGVYRSTDGGRSWTSPPGGAPFPGHSVTALVVDPLRPATLWAGLTGVLKGGLLARSDDRGASFYEVRRWPERAAARVVAVTTASGRRLVAVGGDYGVELTDDDGVSWRASAPPLDPGSGVSFLAFPPLTPGVLLAGSFRHPFRSTDLGRSWTRIADGMVEDTQVFEIDFSPTARGDWWAATCGWVYRSTDAGGTWTRYRDGLTDRRTHVVRRDPTDPARVLAGTTGGLFESRDAGKSFTRLGREVVVNAVVFDPREPRRLLVGTEAEGVLVSEDGGATLTEWNRGLAEARVSAVVAMDDGRVVVARAADGKSGGLWSLDPRTGLLSKAPAAPPATIVALAASGARLLAGTPEGIFVAEGLAGPFARTLELGATAFLASGEGLLAATPRGVYETRDGGKTWGRLGSLAERVDALRLVRVPPGGRVTVAADASGKRWVWTGMEWSGDGRPRAADGTRLLAGGFGRPRVAPLPPLEPVGVHVDVGRDRVVFHPADDDPGVALSLPERGLAVAGWAGDPRLPVGLYLATIGRGLFRFIPD